MTLKEAWDKAEIGQRIGLKDAKFCGEITKKIGEYPRSKYASDEDTLNYILKDHINHMKLEGIFSYGWELVRERKIGWINIWKTDCRKPRTGEIIYKTEEEAKKMKHEDSIATIKIEWFE